MLPAQKHSKTSMEAARAMEPKAQTKREIVYAAILGAGSRGMTDDEIQVATGMNPSTQRPRRIELFRDLMIRDSGDVRPTRGGGNAVVWKVVKPPLSLFD